MLTLVHAFAAAAPEGLEAEAALTVDIVGEVADAAGRPTVGVVAQSGPILVIHVSIAPPSIEHPRVSLRVKVMVHSKVVADFVGNGLRMEEFLLLKEIENHKVNFTSAV